MSTLRSPLIALASLATAASSQLAFEDVTALAGVGPITYGRGSAMVDFDGDGLLDLACGNDEQENLFYQQRPDHTFAPANALWGVPSAPGDHTWGLVAADFDNDGDPDLYVANGAYYGDQADVVIRNDLDTTGTFTDVSALSTDVLVAADFGVTTLDADNDGFLDVFVGEFGRVSDPGLCFLLRNEDGLSFRDVSAPAGLHTVSGNFRHCSSGDFDNDGWMDVGVGNYDGGPNALFHNDGDGTFTEVAAAAGVEYDAQSFGFVFDDFDNDGWLDVFLPQYQWPTPNDVTRLFLNQQDGTFLDVSLGSGISGQLDMGHHSADLDADGFPELFSGTGSPAFPVPDVLFRVVPDGAGGLIASDITAASGIGIVGATRTHGSPVGDYDNDGDLDVYLSTGGPQFAPNSDEPNALFRNVGNANAWVMLDLDGVVSNRDAVGARAWVETNTGREVHRALLIGKGFSNTDAPTLHFGLGSDTGAERLWVRWPSGIEQVLLTPAIMTRHAMVETGLRLLDGGTTMQLVGPPDHVAELLIGAAPASFPMKKYGGVLGISPPIFGPLPVPLGAPGVRELPVAIPTGTPFSGLQLLVQTWTHAPGVSDGGTLGNVVTVTVP